MESDTWVKNVHQDNMMYSPNMMVSIYLFDSFGNLSDSTNVETDEVEMEIDDESLEDDLAVDDSEESTTYTFSAITLVNTGSTFKTGLYDSGLTCHMSPYRHKFINFISIQRKVLTAVDGGHFEAVGKGDM